MAKAKTAKKRPTKRRVLKIWHIFHFAERFELPDDFRGCRQGPLKFTKDFVGSGSDDESISYQLQMAIVDQYDDNLLLCGVFSKLKNLAANRSRAFRGYLIDENKKPATTKRIGQWLGLDEKRAAAALEKLRVARLIERIDMPKFDLTVNDDPTADPAKPKKQKPRKRKAAARTAENRAKKPKKPTSRASSGKTGQTRKPFKKRKTENLSTTESGKEKTTESKNPGLGFASPGGNAGPKGPANPTGGTVDAIRFPRLSEHEKQNNRQDPNPDDVTQAESQDSLCSEHTTATHPMNPTESDTGQAQESDTLARDDHSTESDAGDQASGTMPADGIMAEPVAGAGPRSASVPEAASPDTASPPDAVDRLVKFYNPACREFAVAIYPAIKCPYPPDSVKAHSELGCFGAAWKKAQQAGLPPSVMSELWDKSITSARQLSKKRGRIKVHKSIEAIWRDTFNKRLAARVAAARKEAEKKENKGNVKHCKR